VGTGGETVAVSAATSNAFVPGETLSRSMVLAGALPDGPLAEALIVLVATGVVWIGSGWFERGARALSNHYGLPPVVQGSIVVAVGSSSPEVASVVVAALAGAFDLGVGAIVGSAVFNVLVIPAVVGIATDEPVDSNQEIVYKEAQFYMLAVSALLITFSLAVIYRPSEESALAGELTRPLALLPIALYGLYLFIQWQEVGDYAAETSAAVDVGRAWLLLVAGLVVILLGVEALVDAVEGLSGTFGIPAFLAGATIVAGATSVPDALVSVRTARDGRGITSLSNVLGSNTFDLLIAIPLGVLIVGTATVNFAVAAPMMGVLTLATILLFVALRTDLSLTDPEAYALLLAYVAFVCWVAAETVGATDYVGGV